MKLPDNLRRAAVRFNQMSLRERLLVAAAISGALAMLWTVAFMDPLSARERAVHDEMTALQESMNGASADGPQAEAARIESLNAELQKVDAQLVSKSAGLIPPQLMVQVIHDVLRHQQGLKLISLHNRPVMPLITPAAPDATTIADASADADDAAASATAQSVESGPYVHPVELVIEGSYLDVLRYLQALEASPWRFYWQVLELETARYPVNRVRIELTTLSMDKEWVGV